MAILVFAKISAFIAGIFGKLLNLTIWILNQSVTIIEQLPFSVWKDLEWTKFETIIAYFAISFLLFAFFKRRRTPVWAGLACILLMVALEFLQLFFSIL